MDVTSHIFSRCPDHPSGWLLCLWRDFLGPLWVHFAWQLLPGVRSADLMSAGLTRSLWLVCLPSSDPFQLVSPLFPSLIPTRCTPPLHHHQPPPPNPTIIYLRPINVYPWTKFSQEESSGKTAYLILKIFCCFCEELCPESFLWWKCHMSLFWQSHHVTSKIWCCWVQTGYRRGYLSFTWWRFQINTFQNNWTCYDFILPFSSRNIYYS